MIQEWLDNGCDYQEGVKLYEFYQCDKMYLERFKVRQNAFFVQKLKEDLLQVLKSLPLTPEYNQKTAVKDKDVKPMEFYPTELHECYRDRINSHLEAKSLKLELNKIGYNEEDKALPIILKIDKLFTLNDRCWQILNHYEETGNIIPYPTENTFKELTPIALVKLLQLKYSTASKRKKTIEKWEKELDSMPPLKRAKKEIDLQQKKEEYLKILNDIEELNLLINEE